MGRMILQEISIVEVWVEHVRLVRYHERDLLWPTIKYEAGDEILSELILTLYTPITTIVVMTWFQSFFCRIPDSKLSSLD